MGVAHGQMSTRDSSRRVMEEFSAGKLDVLVATTIIESGIDNPHTNTLIIEDSQRFGPGADVPAERARGPFGSTQAYAYFMFPEQRSTLTEEAQARLTALDEHHGLGKRHAHRHARPWRFAAPAALWVLSSPVTCPRWVSICSRRCSAQAVNATREGDLKAAEAAAVRRCPTSR